MRVFFVFLRIMHRARLEKRIVRIGFSLYFCSRLSKQRYLS